MRRVLSVLLKCLLCLKIGTTLAKENEVKLIVDVGKSYGVPTAMTAYLCWEPHFKSNLSLELGKIENPILIRFVSSKFDKVIRQDTMIEQDTMLIVNLKCPGVVNFLLQALKVNDNIFNSPFRWLIIGNGTNKTGIPPEIFEMKIFINSEVIIAWEYAHGDFRMDLIYKRIREDEWVTEHYGIWNKFGLQKTKQTSLTIVMRRRNLARRKIHVAYNLDDETVGVGVENCDDRIRESPNAHSVTQWGLHLILPLYDFMNATRYNIFTDDWGYFVNGSWNGIIKVMFNEETELSGTPIFLTARRQEVARYLINPVNTVIRFVFREPPLSYQNNLFLLPFNKAVWSSLLGMVLILMTVVYANGYWEWRKSAIVLADDDHVAQPSDKLSISDVAMMVVGAISQQGSFVELRGGTGRLVMFTLFLVFLFLFTAYSASIVVLLQSTSKQIRTLSDLLNSKLELGVQNTSYSLYYFTKATDPLRKAIYHTKIAPRGSKPKFMTLDEGVKKMQKEPFAFHMDLGAGYKLVAKYFFEHEKCGLQEIVYIPQSKPWLTCRKGSPYEELIKIGLYRLQEHGVSDRANRIIYAKKPVCSISGGSFGSVSMVDAYPPFLMLLYGMILASILLVLEIFAHRRLSKKTTSASVTDTVSDIIDFIRISHLDYLSD